MKPRTLFSFAFRGARRGGQRTVIAVLAVAFGVMSLVAMSTLADEVARVLLVDPRLVIGGDAHLWWSTEQIPAGAIEQIQALDDAGKLEAYTLAAVSNALVLQTIDSGQVTFLHSGIGIDPDTYPLLGEIALGAPHSSLAEVLQERGAAVITRDLARERNLSVGDTIRVTNRIAGAPVELRVAGIAISTPSNRGGLLYYTLDTAEMVTGHPDPATDLYMLWKGDSAETLAELQRSGWRSRTPEAMGRNDEKMRTTFNFMLKGAGILGLIVGGIAIANTMQVLLARRVEDVAILKSLGYTRRDLIALLLVETALIGLLGSGLGVGAATLLSLELVNTVGQIVTLFLAWRFDPLLSLGGLLVGVTTTGIFALHAILRASDARPASLFRDLPTPQRNRWFRTASLYGLLALPFAGITSIVLGSVVQGIGILLLALAGLLVFGLLLGGIMWAALRILPTFRFHLLRMARNNMRRRGWALIFALIAIFVGVFTLGLSITIISVSMDEYARRTFSTQGYNLAIFADAAQEGAIRAALAAHPIDPIGVRYELPAANVSTGGSAAHPGDSIMLQGRDRTLWDLTVEGAPWNSRVDGAYLPADLTVPAGTKLVVTAANGRRRSLTVVGTYAPVEWDEGLVYPADGVLVGREFLFDLDQDAVSIQVAGEAPPAELAEIGEQLGGVLPRTAVITSIDVDDLFSSTLKNLLIFATLMAGLALAAGAVLIANAVSLAMIERQYEIGVLKAIGYSRSQVLGTIVLEYGLIALIASVAGLLAVELFILALQVIQEEAGALLHVNLATGSLIMLVGTGLTILTALAAAWQPTRVRPLVVLNRKT